MSVSNKGGVLETVLPGRDGEHGEESDIRIRLHAPGQRGILQSIMDIKRNASRLLPAYGDGINKSKSALKKHRRRAKDMQRLVHSLNKAKKYVDFLQLSNTENSAVSIEKRAKAIKIVAKCLESALTSHEATVDIAEETSASLQEGIKEIDTLSREFQSELKRVNAVGDSWMDVKWTADNSTAVGRGPPGHLAYSPFTQYKLPYDVVEVRKVIEESNKRVR